MCYVNSKNKVESCNANMIRKLKQNYNKYF